MADSPPTSVRKQYQNSLLAFERQLLANAPHSIAEKRRLSKRSIRRLEEIIALQKERLKETRHQSGLNPSHFAQRRISIEDVLLISKYTLETLRQSAQTLELSWSMLE